MALREIRPQRFDAPVPVIGNVVCGMAGHVDHRSAKDRAILTQQFDDLGDLLLVQKTPFHFAISLWQVQPKLFVFLEEFWQSRGPED